MAAKTGFSGEGQDISGRVKNDKAPAPSQSPSKTVLDGESAHSLWKKEIEQMKIQNLFPTVAGQSGVSEAISNTILYFFHLSFY